MAEVAESDGEVERLPDEVDDDEDEDDIGTQTSKGTRWRTGSMESICLKRKLVRFDQYCCNKNVSEKQKLTGLFFENSEYKFYVKKRFIIFCKK